MQPSRRPRGLYIAGNGHSGSTVLEFLLACSPDAVGLGEVDSVLRACLDGGRTLDASREQSCMCGCSAGECAFWGPVLTDLEALGGGEGGRARRDDARQAWMAAAYELLARHFERRFPGTTPIDSSKNMPMFGWFSDAFDGDVAAIHLIRDVRSWSTSTRRWSAATSASAPARRSSRAALAHAVHFSYTGRFVRWYRRNRAFDGFFASRPERVLHVSYEELATNPMVLESLYPMLGLTPPEVLHQPHLANSHAIGGNGALRNPAKGASTVYSTRWLSEGGWLLPSLVLRRVMSYNAARVYGDSVATNPIDTYRPRTSVEP